MSEWEKNINRKAETEKNVFFLFIFCYYYLVFEAGRVAAALGVWMLYTAFYILYVKYNVHTNYLFWNFVIMLM